MRLEGKVDKAWGSENIWATNDKYCCKFLNFNQGGKFSMHFHGEKEESWYVLKGKFIMRWVDVATATEHSKELVENDVVHLGRFIPHQLECISEGGATIIEVSTPDSVEDNFRIRPGDSQKA